MNEPRPEPQPASASLGQAPPHPDWAQQFVGPYREHLLKLIDLVDERCDQLSSELDAVAERVDKELDRHQIPDASSNPTEVEWLTRRAAQADYDLASARTDLEKAEARLVLERAMYEFYRLELQLGQVDHLIENGPYAAGNNAQLEVLTLTVEECSVDVANAVSKVDIFKRKLAASKRMHREIHTALRKARQAGARSRKK